MIQLRDILHVPSLQAPLLSAQKLHQSSGCSIVAGNMGAFLSFPHFIIPVDDSADCLVATRLLEHPKLICHVHFSEDNCVVATSAIIDNTQSKCWTRICNKRVRLKMTALLLHLLSIHHPLRNFLWILQTH